MTAAGREACPPCPETDDIRGSQDFVSEMARQYDGHSLTSGVTILMWTMAGTVAAR